MVFIHLNQHMNIRYLQKYDNANISFGLEPLKPWMVLFVPQRLTTIELVNRASKVHLVVLRMTDFFKLSGPNYHLVVSQMLQTNTKM